MNVAENDEDGKTCVLFVVYEFKFKPFRNRDSTSKFFMERGIGTEL